MKKDKRRAPAARSKGKARVEPTTTHDLDTAPAAVQAKVRELLVNGSTFEDVVATLAGMGKATLTLPAVKNYYRSHLDIQEERIKWQLGAADKLKKWLKDPDSAQGRLAESVLMTGMLGVNARTETSGPQDAFKVQSEQDSHHLKSELARAERAKIRAQIQLMRVKFNVEHEKVKQLKYGNKKLMQMVDDAGGRAIRPEAIRQIQEIYGLLDEKPTRKEEHAEANVA